MKKLNLQNYYVEVQTKEGLKKIPYDIKGSIKNILFDPRQQLNHLQLFEAMEVYRKIKEAKEDILLEDAEYSIIDKSLNAFRGWTENDYEFVRRIKDAENIEMK